MKASCTLYAVLPAVVGAAAMSETVAASRVEGQGDAMTGWIDDIHNTGVGPGGGLLADDQPYRADNPVIELMIVASLSCGRAAATEALAASTAA